ncbi:hypothetical protein ACLF9J_07915, partial [Helicobacter pylori]
MSLKTKCNYRHAMLKVCLKFLECERNFRVGKEWIRVIRNNWGTNWNGGLKNKALKIKRIIKLNASL